MVKAEFVKEQKGLSVFVLALREVEHLVKAEFVKGQKGLSVFVLALMEVETWSRRNLSRSRRA